MRPPLEDATDHARARRARSHLQEHAPRLLEQPPERVQFFTYERKNEVFPHRQETSFFEDVEHPIVGTHPVVRPPFTFATVDRWNRTHVAAVTARVRAECGLADLVERLEALYRSVSSLK